MSHAHHGAHHAQDQGHQTALSLLQQWAHVVANLKLARADSARRSRPQSPPQSAADHSCASSSQLSRTSSIAGRSCSTRASRWPSSPCKPTRTGCLHKTWCASSLSRPLSSIDDLAAQTLPDIKDQVTQLEEDAFKAHRAAVNRRKEVEGHLAADEVRLRDLGRERDRLKRAWKRVKEGTSTAGTGPASRLS